MSSSSSSFGLQWRARGALLLLILSLLVVLGVSAAAVARHLLLPKLPELKSWAEAQASQALGVPLVIGKLDAQWRGWTPIISAREVSIGQQPVPALKLSSVSAVLSWESVYRGMPVFERLELDGPTLRVRRDKAGRISIADITLDPNAKSSGNESISLEWLVAQDHIRIRGATIEWLDEKRGAPLALLTHSELTLSNRNLRHQFELTAELKTQAMASGAPLQLKGNFSHPLLAQAGDLSRYKGEAFVQLENADLAAVRAYADLPFELTRGHGSARVWLGVAKQQVTSLLADVALRDVSARFAKSADPIVLERLSGRVKTDLTKSGLNLEAQALEWKAAQHTAVAPLDWALSYRPEGADAGGSFKATRLELAELQHIMRNVALPEGLRLALKNHNPKGELRKLQASWKGPIDQLADYDLSAAFSKLSLDAVAASGPAPAAGLHAGIPGFSGVSGSFKARRNGGNAELAVDKGSVSLPGVLEPQDIALTQLRAALNWTRATATSPWVVDVDVPSFDAPHGAGRVRAIWTQARATAVPALAAGSASRATASAAAAPASAARPGFIDLKAQFTRGEAKFSPQYLPLSVSKNLRDYLLAAIVGGSTKDMSLVIKGDIYDFPYGDAPGEFKLVAKVDDARLDYLPAPANPVPWPQISKLSGTLMFDKTRMVIKDARGQVLGVQMQNIQGGIGDVRDPVLSLRGNLAGPLDDYLKFVQSTPLNGLTAKALDQARARGNAKLDLSMSIPIDNSKDMKLDGKLELAGNDFALDAINPALARVTGGLSFSEKSFALKGVRAQGLGGELVLDGGTQRDGSVSFGFAGTLTSEALKREAAFKSIAPIARRMEGTSRYEANVGFKQGLPQISVSSSLQGMALDFPAPLGKTAESILPFKLASRVTSATDAQLTKDELNLTVGGSMLAKYEREWPLNARGEKTARVARGVLAINNPATLPDAGVFAHVSMPQVSVDAWTQAFASSARADEPSSVLPGAEAGYAPNLVVFQADELITQRKLLKKVVVGASFRDGQWQANLDAQDVAGYLAWRPSARGGLGRVTARLARFVVPPDSKEVDQIFDSAPEQLPAVDVIVEDFQFKGRKWGRVELEAVNRNVEGVREWRLNRLSVVNPEASFTASGNWVPVGAQAGGGSASAARRTAMNFKLEMQDAGSLLARLGMPGTMRRGAGRIEGNLSWVGAPYSFDYPSMTGKLAVDMTAGQFLKVEPGAAKLLSILSLQMLPRRIALDFRDVFSEGFSFDQINGEAQIERGNAFTNNLKIRGSQAAVFMEGSADLARETTKLFVVVEPDVNFGTASLAYAAINPAVGLTTFLLQWIARKPLGKALAQQFEVSGPWVDPKVERVDRTAALGSNPPAAGDAQATTSPRQAPPKSP